MVGKKFVPIVNLSEIPQTLDITSPIFASFGRLVTQMTTSGELKTLEVLLKEFYDFSTSNKRKKEIEEILKQFQRLPDSWCHCVAFLKESQDAYVQMFCLIVLDNTVTQRWRSLSVEQKGLFTQFLHELLYSKEKHFDGHFSFVRNKIAKVIIEIGRADWPHAYASFMDNILKMLEFEEYVATGLLLLRTASEELMAESIATNGERRDELRRLLLADVPRMLDRIGAVLDSLLRVYRSDATRAPPSSPRETCSNVDWSTTASLNHGRQQLVAFDTTCCMHLDERGLLLATAAFLCLNSLFTWVPPASIKSALLVQIFHFVSSCMNVVSSGRAMQDTYASETRASVSYCACGQQIENASQFLEVSVSALSCLSDLLARSYTPPDFKQFVAQASVYTYVTLCRLCALDWTGERDALANRLFEDDVRTLFRDAEPLAVGAGGHTSLDKSFSTDLASLHCTQLHASDYGPPRNVTTLQTDHSLALVRANAELRYADEGFLEEFTKYVRIFLVTHFRFLEQLDLATDSNDINHVSVRDLLAAFYRYTLAQPALHTCGLLSMCMDAWNAVLDCINQPPCSPAHGVLRAAYTDMFASLANQLTMKMQFRFNYVELEMLDGDRRAESDCLDDDSCASDLSLLSHPFASELQAFVARCAKMLGKLSIRLPTFTFTLVADLFATHATKAIELGRYFVSTSDTTSSGEVPTDDLNGNEMAHTILLRLPASLANRENLHAIRCALRDLATFTHTVARLMPDHLCGSQEQFSSRFADGELLVTHLVNLAKLCAAKRVWRAKCVVQFDESNVKVSSALYCSLPLEFVAVHCETLRALTIACSTWLAQFHTLCQSSHNATLLDSLNSLFHVLLDECIAPAFTHDAPQRVVLAAVQLFDAVVRCRPARLLDAAGFRALTERAASIDSVRPFSNTVLAALYRAVATGFVVVQPDGLSQAQSVLFDRFVVQLSTPLFQLAAYTDEMERDPSFLQQQRVCTMRALFALKEIVDCLHGETTRVKQMAARSLDSAVQCALGLVYSSADSLELLDALATFVLSAAQALRTAFRPGLVDCAWSTFAAILNDAGLARAAASGAAQHCETACAALTRFIELLTFVVQDAAFRTRLHDVLHVALNSVYPTLAAHDAFLFVRPTFYAFLQDVLTNNWHYFFKQQFAFGAALGTKMSAEGDSEEVEEHHKLLVSILSVLADGLLNSQPTVFRAALGTLETVHNRHRLYARPTFRTVMLERFSQLLLSRLVERVNSLQHDEICAALFNIFCTVNSAHFRTVLVPQFLASQQSTNKNFSPEQQDRLCNTFADRDNDQPSFTYALERFAQDYRFYAQANSAERERDSLGLLRFDSAVP